MKPPRIRFRPKKTGAVKMGKPRVPKGGVSVRRMKGLPRM